MGVHALVDKNGVMKQEEKDMTVAEANNVNSKEVTESSKLPPKSPGTKRKRYVLHRNWDNARSNKKNTGIRQKRRLNDLHNLLSMAEELEEVDVYEPSPSAFSALFMEDDNMNVWNDFLNRPEEDQYQILNNNKSLSDSDTDADSCNEFEMVETDDRKIDHAKDGREGHPAFTPEQCFRRIDMKLRSFLHKNHLPMGTLEYLERDLVMFFNEDPNTVHITKLSSSFERLLVHALCQYLDLTSRSFDVEDSGVRHTQIENKQPYFSPPDISLTQYLEQCKL